MPIGEIRLLYMVQTGTEVQTYILLVALNNKINPSANPQPEPEPKRHDEL